MPAIFRHTQDQSVLVVRRTFPAPLSVVTDHRIPRERHPDLQRVRPHWRGTVSLAGQTATSPSTARGWITDSWDP